MDNIVYHVDAGQRLTYANRAWDVFATENDAPDLISDRILGKRLDSFISDPGTRDFYREALARAFDGRVFEFSLRCDSPERRRLLAMRIQETDAEVVFETRLIRQTPRPFRIELLRRGAPRNQDFVKVCGWCKRMNTRFAVWQELEIAVANFDFFKRPALPMISHGICPDCSKKLSEQLHSHRNVDGVAWLPAEKPA